MGVRLLSEVPPRPVRGATWAPLGDLGLLAPNVADISVATGHHAAFYADMRVGGVPAVVLTTPLEPGFAVPPDGAVEVRLAADELSVRDHGPGIDPDDLPHLFDRFYWSRSAHAVPGSGLGLAVACEVARGHGGTIAAEHANGGGTLMRLTLPPARCPRPSRTPRR